MLAWSMQFLEPWCRWKGGFHPPFPLLGNLAVISKGVQAELGSEDPPGSCSHLVCMKSNFILLTQQNLVCIKNNKNSAKPTVFK